MLYPRVRTACHPTTFCTLQLPLCFTYEAQRECSVSIVVFHGAQLCLSPRVPTECRLTIFCTRRSHCTSHMKRSVSVSCRPWSFTVPRCACSAHGVTPAYVDALDLPLCLTHEAQRERSVSSIVSMVPSCASTPRVPTEYRRTKFHLVGSHCASRMTRSVSATRLNMVLHGAQCYDGQRI